MTAGNFREHMERDLLSELQNCLGDDDLDDLQFFKHKAVIDDFFGREKINSKRKEMYNRLIRELHPDKEM